MQLITKKYYKQQLFLGLQQNMLCYIELYMYINIYLYIYIYILQTYFKDKLHNTSSYKKTYFVRKHFIFIFISMNHNLPRLGWSLFKRSTSFLFFDLCWNIHKYLLFLYMNIYFYYSFFLPMRSTLVRYIYIYMYISIFYSIKYLKCKIHKTDQVEWI